MGIRLQATVAEVMDNRRRRRHRSSILNNIEYLILSCSQGAARTGTDISLWRNAGDNCKKTFVSKSTWNLIRQRYPKTDWYKSVWFKYSTPKYAFLTWLAIQNRLSTGDRMKQWNAGQPQTCILCQSGDEESCKHLFFECR
ncbi:uncharacterized protein LOC112083923 [Eutrema salsugineum]|uniref:uncharacterized protein LOC112083923 n=1 Tax=Eutrema salsugineum TaxID=72664 RepID=UPI000CECFBA0|nr:uncharacterized protein LOC112083923 [Eutrema salsugineum]